MKVRVIIPLILLSASFTWAAKPAPPPASPVDVLKDEAPNLMEWALAPLNESVPRDVHQNLTLLREGLLDEGKGDPQRSIDVYRQGYRLCQGLLAAYDDRDAARARAGMINELAKANHAAPTTPALDAVRNFKFSWPQYKKEQAERGELHAKSKADTNAVAERLKGEWVNTVSQMRARLDGTYAQFREALREDLKDSSTLAAEPPKPAKSKTSKKEPSAPVAVSSKKTKPVPGAPAVSSTSPASATQDSPFVNSLGMKFVPVPETKVLFCIHDTRKGDYRKYADAKPGVDSSWKNVKSEIGDLPVSEGEDHPVVMVSKQDAQAFCQWLSAKEGRTYRLPEDAEWSWAVGLGELEDATAPAASKDRVIKSYPWRWGHKPPEAAGNFADLSLWEKLSSSGLVERFPDGFAEKYRDGYATTSPVMSFKPNDLGLYDMAGNVWQWLEDSGYKRGGSWECAFKHGRLLPSCRAAASEGEVIKVGRSSDEGFRVVLVK